MCSVAALGPVLLVLLLGGSGAGQLSAGDHSFEHQRPAAEGTSGTMLETARTYVAGWGRLGIWLPDSTQVDFFNEQFEHVHVVLAEALTADQRRTRRAAAFVIGLLGEKAQRLGKAVVEALQVEPESSVRIRLCQALRDVEYRHPEALAALRAICADTRGRGSLDETIDEQIYAAAALYVVSPLEEERERAFDFVAAWLKLPAKGLSAAETERYWQRSWSAIDAVGGMRGATAAVPLLEALEKAPTSRIKLQAGRALSRLHREAFDRLDDDAKTRITELREFVRLFPTAHVWVSNRNAVRISPRGGFYASAEVLLWGRYFLRMSVRIGVDWRNGTVSPRGVPVGELEEVKLLIDPNTGPDAGYIIGMRRALSRADWDKLCAAQGHLDVLGADLVRDKPIEGLEQWWQQ